jgi:hypothetical protein
MVEMRWSPFDAEGTLNTKTISKELVTMQQSVILDIAQTQSLEIRTNESIESNQRFSPSSHLSPDRPALHTHLSEERTLPP